MIVPTPDWCLYDLDTAHLLARELTRLGDLPPGTPFDHDLRATIRALAANARSLASTIPARHGRAGELSSLFPPESPAS